MVRSYSFVLIVLLAGIFAVNGGNKAAAGSVPQSAVKSHQKKTEKLPVVIIYTMSTCPHCAEAKEYLTKQGIPFVNREVDTDNEHMEELVKIYDDMKVPDERRGVPFFIVGKNTRLQGFDKVKLEEALKAAAGR